MADDEFGEPKKPIINSSIENNNCETTLNIKLKNLDIESEEDAATGCVHYKRRAKFVVSNLFNFFFLYQFCAFIFQFESKSK